ncbi:MAG: EAL domain-containing protein [Burkholderiales bacterium]|nr:EAL domain-containing protein [Burkholderiales bacterium]
MTAPATRSLYGAVEELLYRICVYVVPFAIAAMTVAALFFWAGQYGGVSGTPLDLRIIHEAEQALDPGQAGERLQRAPATRHYDTRLSETPVWIRFSVSPTVFENGLVAVELPSRHAVEVSCWDGSMQRLLGTADRQGASGRLAPVKAGFALRMPALQEPVDVICRVRSSGPARISALAWPPADLADSAQKFHRNSGLVDGGLLLLAMFMLMTALISREWIYVLFAAWLVANLRMAAISAGWDAQWLERVVPEAWLFEVKKLSMAAFYALTYTLFSRLFADDLKRVGYRPLLVFAQWSSVLVLLVAPVLSYASFLPYLWATTAVGISTLLFFLARIVMVTRSKVAVWYAAALGITLFASFFEVIAAALGFKSLIGVFNAVTAALSSSLIAAMAIAEQLRQERDQRVQAQAALRSTYEAIPIGLFTLDAEGRLVRGNPALLDMLAIRSGEGARHWSTYFEDGAWARMQAMLKAGAGEEIEVRSRPAPAGGERADAGAAAAAGEAAQKRFLVKATLANDKIEGSLQDVTDKSKASEQLRFLAENDPLTGVLNRRGVELVLDEALAALAEGRPLALAYLDLDRFKLINDLYGHGAGDEVLIEVCARVGEMLSHGQRVGRVGGDEFVVVMPGTPIQSAAWSCRGIVERIGTLPYRIGDKAFQVRGSIGLVEVSAGTSAKDAISAADRACREAKSGAGNGLVVYEKNATVFRQREAELRIIERLGSSAAHEGLFLEMQPIMSLQSPQDSLNFEVLLRMREADNTVVSAASVISVAENNGRIGVIDRWVIATVLAWIDANYDRLKKTQFVCVNLSGASLNDERFVHDAFALLAQYVHAAGRLCIEITESVALHDLENTRRFIDRVRGYGAKVALDDFGAGYTSFSYLKELPADVLKIDGNFIVGVKSHPANLAIVEAIVSLARNLGMKTIAEWVEDRQTLEALAEAGVDYVQGFAIARPQAPARLLAAASSASFIADERLLQFVRTLHGADRTLELWDHLEIVKPGGLH